jgi:hypothetical protein
MVALGRSSAVQLAPGLVGIAASGGSAVVVVQRLGNRCE